MKYISWNVNGLRAIINKGFDDVLAELDADCVCLQEIKLVEGQLDHQFEGYKCFYHYAERKGYSGTAIFTRREPLTVTRGLGHASTPDVVDNEGRVLTLEFDDHYLVNVYTPNAQTELKRLDFRMAWDKAFAAYLRELDQTKPVVVCGDFNVAHQEIDLKNPKANRGNPGFTDQEREGFTRLLGDEFIDTYRYLYPEGEDYTWWSYRFNARAKNIGWRIDYFLISRRLSERMQGAAVYPAIVGSDHCPISLILK